MNLIIGGAGFLGSHLVELLLEMDLEVTVIDDMSRGSKENLAQVWGDSNLTVIDADVFCYEGFESLVADHEQVYHLAARIGGVGYLRDQPATIMVENDQINQRVFKTCAETGVNRVLYASSSMLYAEATTFPTNEKMTTQLPPPPGSYGFQKLNGEYYCNAFRREYGLEYVAPRIFNAVGPRDWPASKVGHGHVVPDMVRKIVTETQNPVKIKGRGSQTRCFTDVRDTVKGLYRCMEVPEAANQTFNIGSTTEISIIELVKCIWELSDRDGQPQYETKDPFEKDVERRVPDITKAERVLDWSPEYGLEETLEWYLDVYEDYYGS